MEAEGKVMDADLQDGVFWMFGSRERRYFARKSCV